MVRFTVLAMALLVVAGVPGARAQDADEVKRLKARIELLEAKLEAATLKIEKLEEANRQLKAGGAKGQPAAKAGGQRTLSDILTEGTTIRGDYRFSTGNRGSGEWSLTIKERMGKKFKGLYTVRQLQPEKGEGAEADAEGEIDGDRITFRPVNTAKMMATATGRLKNDAIELNWSGRGGQAVLVAKVPK
jgi:hypothetical protein